MLAYANPDLLIPNEIFPACILFAGIHFIKWLKSMFTHNLKMNRSVVFVWGKTNPKTGHQSLLSAFGWVSDPIRQ